MKNQRPVFATDPHGKVFIYTKASGIPKFLMCMDGMKIFAFEGDDRDYLLFDDVIDWHKKNESKPSLIHDMEKCRNMFKQRKVIEV